MPIEVGDYVITNGTIDGITSNCKSLSYAGLCSIDAIFQDGYLIKPYPTHDDSETLLVKKDDVELAPYHPKIYCLKVGDQICGNDADNIYRIGTIIHISPKGLDLHYLIRCHTDPCKTVWMKTSEIKLVTHKEKVHPVLNAAYTLVTEVVQTLREQDYLTIKDAKKEPHINLKYLCLNMADPRWIKWFKTKFDTKDVPIFEVVTLWQLEHPWNDVQFLLFLKGRGFPVHDVCTKLPECMSRVMEEEHV